MDGATHAQQDPTLQAVTERLIDDGQQIVRDGDRALHLLDPLLAEWVRRR